MGPLALRTLFSPLSTHTPHTTHTQQWPPPPTPLPRAASWTPSRTRPTTSRRPSRSTPPAPRRSRTRRLPRATPTPRSAPCLGCVQRRWRQDRRVAALGQGRGLQEVGRALRNPRLSATSSAFASPVLHP